MRKKYIISALLLVSLSIGGCAFADTYSDDTSFRGSVTQTNCQLQPIYMNWYNVDKDRLKATFRPLSKDKIKNLSKEDKAQYKKAEKIEKLLATGNFADLQKAKSLDTNYIPTILAYYNNAKTGNERITWLRQLDNVDTQGIFSKEVIHFYYGLNFYDTNQYSNAIEYLQPIADKYVSQNKYNNYVYFIISLVANSYYETRNYNNAIKYAKLIPSTAGEEYYNALQTLTYAYKNSGNNTEAYKYAKVLYQTSPNDYKICKLLGDMATNDNEKLGYYHKAKQLGAVGFVYKDITNELIKIYERKVANASKSITGYYDAPDVATLINNDMENELNKALQYRGNDLKAAFDSLNRKIDKNVAKSEADRRAAQQRAADNERIYAINQQNKLQAQQNQLLQQQNQILKAPRYSYTNYYKGWSSTVSY